MGKDWEEGERVRHMFNFAFALWRWGVGAERIKALQHSLFCTFPSAIGDRFNCDCESVCFNLVFVLQSRLACQIYI